MGKLGPNRGEVMGRWMKLHNFISSPNDGHVAVKGGVRKPQKIQFETKGKNIFET